MIRKLASAFLLTACAGTLFAQDSPYYTVYRTWALAPLEKEAGGKIISFLPRRYLLYIEDRDRIVSIDGSDYIRAITQDGAEVLVFEQNISRKTYKDSIGEHEVVFNTAYQLCKSIGCVPDEISAIPVERGDSFKIIDTPNGFYKLEGTRPDGTFQGFISVQQLSKMKDIGQITRVDDPHPRYRIKKQKSSALQTTCSETKDINTKWPIQPNDTATGMILERIRLGVVEGSEVRLTQEIGETDHIYRFYLYSIEDREHAPDSPQRQFHVAAGFKIHCSLADVTRTVKEDYIQSVTFLSDRNGNEVTFTIDEFGTPKNLIDKTRAPYMVSINTESHFNRALELLSIKIDDRTLAGFALTEINRSCVSAERRPGSNSICLDYDY